IRHGRGAVRRLAAVGGWPAVYDRPAARRLHGDQHVSIAAPSARFALGPALLGVMLTVLYAFLYAPILYVIYTSFAADIVWPFPPSFSAQSYTDLIESSLYAEAMRNSLVIGFGSAFVSTILATAAGMGLLRYRSRRRTAALLVLMAPL